MGFLEERDLSDVPTIPEFFKGKTIFITGGSGFMGQVLIEKLLYSCSELKRIYVLIRQKRGANMHQRLAELYSSSLFDRLKAEKPGLFEAKVFAVAGDLHEVDIGMSKEDQNMLRDCVNIIYHCAASVRFNDDLREASNTNLKSTRDMVSLAREMKNLLVFVHVSTCYANTNYGKYLEERLYPPHTDWRETLEICEKLDIETIKKFTPKFIGGLPNTYVFTKQLAEHLVYEQKGKLPVVIIRPSVVTSISDEPFKGWINNYNGPIGLSVAVGKGIIRDALGYEDLVTDYIPVDYCIKHFIAAAWIRGTKPLESTDDIPIYNCCASKELVISLGDLANIGTRYGHDYPLDSMIRAPKVSLTVSPTFHYLKFMLFQLIPAIFMDTLLWLLSKKPILVKIQRRIYHVDVALEHYLSHYWHFDNKNFVLLRSCIKEQDKKDFNYDLRQINKDLYIKNSVIGAKKYLLKEKLEEYPKARRYLFSLKLISLALRLLFVSCLTLILVKTAYFRNTVDNILKIKAF